MYVFVDVTLLSSFIIIYVCDLIQFCYDFVYLQYIRMYVFACLYV